MGFGSWGGRISSPSFSSPRRSSSSRSNSSASSSSKTESAQVVKDPTQLFIQFERDFGKPKESPILEENPVDPVKIDPVFLRSRLILDDTEALRRHTKFVVFKRLLWIITILGTITGIVAIINLYI